MSVSINDVVAITGQPGLYVMLKSNDNVIVVESLDSKRRRQLVKGNMMVSKLTDVSIYTEEDSEPLPTVLQEMNKQFGKELPVSKKSSNDELMQFLAKVLPSFDDEKVYPSNVKKLISWYNILMDEQVDLTVETPAEDAEVEVEEVTEEAPAEEKAPKSSGKKTASKKKADDK